MKNPKVTIIISAFNHEKYVAESIQSVLDQSFQDFELIIIDNGSTDSTFKIIKTFNDSRIRVFQIKKNTGFSYALNYALIKAKGEYISLFTSDDISLFDKLDQQVKYLDQYSDVGAVFSKAYIIDERGNAIKGEYYSKVFDQKNRNRFQWLNHFFYNGNCICFPSTLIRKTIYKEILFENNRLAQLHDFDLWIRLCLKRNIHILNEKLVKLRIMSNKSNASADTPENRVRSMFEFGHVLKQFLLIPTTQDFLKIFPDAKKKYNDISDDELIPFYVARQALEVEHMFHQKFALDVLFDLMRNKKIVSKLNKQCNFDYTDFIKLTGKHDIYHVEHIEYQKDKINQLVSEKEKFKSFFYQLKYLFKKIILPHA